MVGDPVTRQSVGRQRSCHIPKPDRRHRRRPFNIAVRRTSMRPALPVPKRSHRVSHRVEPGGFGAAGHMAREATHYFMVGLLTSRVDHPGSTLRRDGDRELCSRGSALLRRRFDRQHVRTAALDVGRFPGERFPNRSLEEVRLGPRRPYRDADLKRRAVTAGSPGGSRTPAALLPLFVSRSRCGREIPGGMG